MRINTNISAMNTYGRLTNANASKSNSLAKLSSGLRINKAGDDAAGLAISEKMKSQIGGLKQATRNAQDGISLIQTAEGALNETHAILGRMRDLAVQGANGTLSQDDRGEINKEFEALKIEITRISDNTEFNTKKLLTGDTTDPEGKQTFTFQIGANGSQEMDVKIGQMNTENLGLTSAKLDASGSTDTDLTAAKTALDKATGAAKHEAFTGTDSDAIGAGMTREEKLALGVDEANLATATWGSLDATVAGLTADAKDIEAKQTAYATAADPVGRKASSDAIADIDAAIKEVSAQRSDLGAAQNRLSHTVKNLTTTQENLSEANSRIRDVDMAEEMMEFTKNNILSQAATSMLSQANAMPNSVLGLLQG